MSEEGWYHCGRCGSLFRGTKGAKCSECSHTPIVTESEMAFVMASVKGAEKHRQRRSAARPSRHSRSPKRKNKKAGIIAFVVCWILALGLIAALMGSLRSKGGEQDRARLDIQERINFVREETFRECVTTFKRFILTNSDEGRTAYTVDPQGTLLHMVRFKGDELKAAEGVQYRWGGVNSLENTEVPVLEAIALMDDGNRVECVFQKNDDGNWVIDWNHLVRYSELDWRLFLEGQGSAVGDFRLLARRRSGETGERDNIASISLVSVDPWNPSDVRIKSPSIEVDPHSEVARLLQAGFDLLDQGKAPFGSQLHREDPASMLRVHVRLRRDPVNPEIITIDKVHACHWKTLDDPGVVPSLSE